MAEGGRLLQVIGVSRRFGGGRNLFGMRRPAVHALEAVTLSLRRGETLGVVGESGCGKSTLGRLVAGLDRPSEGSVSFADGAARDAASKDRKALARRIQFVFQDPLASLNPRKRVRAILEAPLIHLLSMPRSERAARLDELMDAVNLDRAHLERYPHEFSGGQAQRIAIARALAAEPEILVLDEPVSALDVSVQAQVLNLLDSLKKRFGLTYLFISHDLSVVESISDRVAVMYFGRLAEVGPVRRVFARPRHHYTGLLLRSAPVPGRPPLAPESAPGELPDPYDPPAGCPFHARCPAADATCRRRQPPLEPTPGAAHHLAACFHPDSVRGGLDDGPGNARPSGRGTSKR